MSIVTALRDYIELVNNVYDAMGPDKSIQVFFQQSFLYLLGSIKYCCIYLLSFQWFRDLCYLPVIIPRISVSLLKGQFFLESPLANLFSFLEPATYSSNTFLLGVLNSFFLALPFSCAQLVFVRRLFIQGDYAGLASGLGLIFGHVSFLTCVIFGIRFVIVPWFSFEPFTFLVGLFLIFWIIYDMARERGIRRIPLSEKNTLLKMFSLNFALTWTEQAAVFQYLGNLTFGAEPTILENFSSKNQLHYLITHFNYVFGLLIGHCLFTFLVTLVLKKLYEFIYIRFYPGIEATWIKKVNWSLMVGIIALNWTSVPYYTFEYLVFNPLGFISRDQTFTGTRLDPTGPKDSISLLGMASQYQTLDTDPSIFGRGRYLKKTVFDPQTFEDVNYQGEYKWTTRYFQEPTNQFDRQRAQRFLSKWITYPKKDFGKLPPDPDSFKPRKSLKKYYQNVDTDSYRFEKRYREQYAKRSLRDYPLRRFTKEQFRHIYIRKNPGRQLRRLELAIKDKYYSNPIYKFLLSLDVDQFLSGQPKKFRLSPEQEKDLLQKRMVLANYYDSIRLYKNVPYLDGFQELFNGSKSFADRVYNQQFKGTLSVVRRLFLITPESNDFPSNINFSSTILKFDQPLFKEKQNQENSAIHEELDNSKGSSPFIELATNTPFYAGWDNQLRKLVITNRLAPRSVSLYSSRTDTKRIEFTTWPLSKDVLFAKRKPSKLSYSVLFEPKDAVRNRYYRNYFANRVSDQKPVRTTYSYDTLPANVVRTVAVDNAIRYRKLFPPTRGGFVWYGNPELKFRIVFQPFENLKKRRDARQAVKTSEQQRKTDN